MKVFISADIEGITGVTHWNETSKTNQEGVSFVEQMTSEVKAACEGAIKAGAKEIWIKDAHGSGRNIDSSKLPENIKIVRGWSRDPYSMVQGINESFDAAMFIGYHSAAGSGGNPLSHTMRGSVIYEMRINGERVSEFTLYSYACQYHGVPSVFISGDKKITEDAKGINKNIETVAVMEGVGNSTVSIHPDVSVKKIEEEVTKALNKDISKCNIELPEEFVLEIQYVHHYDAYTYSFYPGAELVDECTVRFTSKDYYEIIRAVLFMK
ncbi:M55 family metallopeptidase [Oceanirhabdus sp. W0125-5]|uniref:M55 family metallopeptidase n=1 Tax=Oceanirhabdus sp. W0125-5 TaxID=2999116 RepID=UPI0022F2FA13|nr:M55 family metallopeptidase [Oceanirhabdus sp. W0125-5]WBW95289.1 M55 family metallopeptidase [Oceanirhabdus sp. W0125-5]